MPLLQQDGRRRVAHPAEILPADSAPVYPFHCATAIRPRRCNPAVVAEPRMLPTAVVPSKQLRPSVQLRPARRYPAVVRIETRSPAKAALRFGRPVMALRSWIRYRGQAMQLTLPAISPSVVPLVIYVDPDKAYLVTALSDESPFDVDPDKAYLVN